MMLLHAIHSLSPSEPRKKGASCTAETSVGGMMIRAWNRDLADFRANVCTHIRVKNVIMGTAEFTAKQESVSLVGSTGVALDDLQWGEWSEVTQKETLL